MPRMRNTPKEQTGVEAPASKRLVCAHSYDTNALPNVRAFTHQFMSTHAHMNKQAILIPHFLVLSDHSSVEGGIDFQASMLS